MKQFYLGESFLLLSYMITIITMIVTPPKTNIAPEKCWLMLTIFLLGPGLFSGAFAVSFRESNHFVYHQDRNSTTESVVAMWFLFIVHKSLNKAKTVFLMGSTPRGLK